MATLLKDRRTVKAVISTGLLAGTLDGIAAIVSYLVSGGSDPTRVFLYIASGVFGKEALSGGIGMAALGVLFHYFIAFVWTTLFYLVYLRVTILSKNWYINGAIYGIVIWLGMNLIVLPLSNVPPSSFDLMRAIKGAAILVVCVGLPVSFVTRRHFMHSIPASNLETP